MTIARVAARSLLWLLAVALWLAVEGSSFLHAQQPANDAAGVVRFILNCRKANGAFGPADQEYTDAAWNYPAVRALQLLGEPIENASAILDHGLGSPRGHVGYGHWHFFHQHGIRFALQQAVTPRHRRVTLIHQGFTVRYYGNPFGVDGDFFFKEGGSGRETQSRDENADSFGYYNLASLYYLLAGLSVSGREAANRDELVSYIKARQAPNGGFVDLRLADATPLDNETHLATTFHAVASLKILGVQIPREEQLLAFVESCRTADGGFLFHPNKSLSGNLPDVYYLWSALGVLKSLDAPPQQPNLSVQWIRSLRNADGGYGDQVGWRSRLYSTYYAVHSLAMLTGDARKGCLSAIPKKSQAVRSLPTDLGIHQALFKLPMCQPENLIELQRRGFGLIGLRYDKPDEAARLQAAAGEQKLPLEIILSPEAYPHRARHVGGVELDHVGNFTLDVRWPAERRAIWDAADQAGRQRPSWDDYRRQVIGPMRSLGLIYPEQDFEMELAYRAYDAGANGGDSYNAILVGFNWAPRDFVRVFPWRERYVDKLTPIADCDAHGDFKKWSPQLDHVRHLFLAKGNRYSDFLEAAAARRVVCVIASPEGVASGVSYYGPAEAVEFVRAQETQWRWWTKDAAAK